MLTLYQINERVEMDAGVNDDEVNKMIANLQANQTATPIVTSNTGAALTPAAPSDGSTTPPLPVPPTDSAIDQPPADASIVPPPISQMPPPSAAGNDLENIKHDALSELRPLVDKLELPPDEKFNTLLLIIRSSDDASLIPAAHQAAIAIPDDTKKAAALLDVIKEVDFFAAK
jgi:hypothetical protein